MPEIDLTRSTSERAVACRRATISGGPIVQRSTREGKARMVRSFVPFIAVILAMVALVLNMAVIDTSLATTANTPTAGEGDAPEVCQVTPRTLEEYASLVSRPGTSLSSSPVLDSRPSQPDNGTPADASVVDGVSATVRQFTACTNAGDYLRLAALMTDRLLARSGRSLENGALAQMATPVPLPEEHQAVLEEITDVQVLTDGRASAIVQVNGNRNLMVFVESEGRYLLDDSFEFAVEGTPSP